MHNYWFEKYNIDADYSILEVRDDQLEEIVENKNRTLNGVNKHYPYKQKIVPFLDVLINDAETTS